MTHVCFFNRGYLSNPSECPNLVKRFARLKFVDGGLRKGELILPACIPCVTRIKAMYVIVDKCPTRLVGIATEEEYFLHSVLLT